jgi:GNAT superfamily N-acetyltransferase
MDITFRPFKASDFSGFQELQIEATNGLSAGHYSMDQLSAEEEAVRKPGYLNELLEINLSLAVRGDEIVGSAGWNKHDTATARVRKVFVHPSHTGQGLGSRLLMRVESEFLKLGFRRVICRASMNAISFYEKNGFRKIEQSSMDLGNGIAIPVMMMQKALLQ